MTLKEGIDLVKNGRAERAGVPGRWRVIRQSGTVIVETAKDGWKPRPA